MKVDILENQLFNQKSIQFIKNYFTSKNRLKKAILGLKLRISTDFEEASEKTTFEPKIEKDQGTGIKFRTLKLFS